MLKNRLSYIFIIFFIITGISISAVFIPVVFTLAIVIQIGTILPLGIIYTSISYEWVNSTLYSNLSLTKSSKRTFYSSMVLTMLLFMSVFTVLLFTFFSIFNSLFLILTGWFSYGGKDEFSLIGTGFNWDIIIYTQIVNVMLMFSICYFIEDIITTRKSFYTIILMFLILCFIFGGSLNDYFDFINVNSELNKEGEVVIKNIIGHGGKIVPVYDAALFPTFLYIPSLFFPFYTTGQLVSVAVGEQYLNNILGMSNEISINIWSWSTEAFDKNLYGSIMREGKNGYSVLQVVTASGGAWRWNILWVLPYFYSFLFISLGTSHRKYK